MRGGMQTSSGQVSKRVKRAKTAGTLEHSLARVLAELFREKRLASFVNRVRKRMCVSAVCVFDAILRVVSAKSRIISEEYFLSLEVYGAVLPVLDALRAE